MSAALDEHFARYVVPERSGLLVMELASFNGREPWRRTAERISPPG